MPFRLRGDFGAFAAVPAAAAPTRAVPTIMQSVNKRLSSMRVSDSDWARADDDFVSVFFNSMLNAPLPVNGTPGGDVAVKGDAAQRKTLARRVSKHIPGKSFEQCQPQLRTCNTALTELRAKTNRFREEGIKKEKLPQSVVALVNAEERERKAHPAADPRAAVGLQVQRDAVIANFKPATAVEIQRQIDQSKKDLQAAGTAIARSITHGETNKYISDDAYADYEASIQEALAELKTMQDELDALRASLDPLPLVDARTGLREERRVNSKKAQVKAFACSWKGMISGVLGASAAIGTGIAHYNGQEVLPLLAQSGLAGFAVYTAGAVGTALVIGGVIAGINWILSDDEL